MFFNFQLTHTLAVHRLLSNHKRLDLYLLSKKETKMNETTHMYTVQYDKFP